MLSQRADAERVVVTGLGVVAPNGVGVEAFERALRAGTSAVHSDQDLKRLRFGCQVAAQPELTSTRLDQSLTTLEQHRIRSRGLLYALLAGLEAGQDAGLSPPGQTSPSRNTEWGCVFGAGLPGIDVLGQGIDLINAGQAKRLGSSMIEMQMPSSASAMLAAKFGLGGQVSCNSAACATGTEALLIAVDRIRGGAAKLVLVGSCESPGPHLWGTFDAMRVLVRTFNDEPQRASRPLSASAAGFVPAAGAGALVIESLPHARARGAKVYAEVLGGKVNCGAQRAGGSMTMPNVEAVVECIRGAVNDARVLPTQIDAVCGHLTATQGDPVEVQGFARALLRRGRAFPYINSLKSMIGHALSASGSIELVASVIQLHKGFLHASLNCEDLHPDVAALISPTCIPLKTSQLPKLSRLIKASFGFGDLNACVVLGRADLTE